MEEINTTTSVETTETKVEETATTTESKNVPKNIMKPLFIVFAEFLGYESPLVEWAETMCKGKQIESFKERALDIDAMQIYKEMRKEYSNESLREWFDQFYDVILKEYEENLLNLKKDDLPF